MNPNLNLKTSDPGMEEAFFDTPLCREFAPFGELERLPDESTILCIGEFILAVPGMHYADFVELLEPIHSQVCTHGNETPAINSTDNFQRLVDQLPSN